MANHKLTILQIKSELLDLWTETTVVQSYSQWFNVLKPKLYDHFKIKNAEFLIYDKAREIFLPLQGHKSALEMEDAISVDFSKAQQREVYLQLFKEKGFEFADEVIIFKDVGSEPLAILLIESTKDWRDFSASPYIIEFEKAISNFIKIIRGMGFFVTREKKFRQLFNVTELFNSTMSSEVILDGIMNSLAESFPTFKVDLLLSHEQKALVHSYKLFDYSSDRPSTIDAFVSGEVTIENAKDLGVTLLNAPIKGRQGIYGVLQINAPPDFFFLTTQRNFIHMLANTAGSALENASLFDQSHRLIEDLKLVNETSRKLNSNMNFDEMIEYLKTQLIHAFKPTQIAFVFYREERNYEVSQISTDYFKSSSSEVYINFVSSHYKNGNESFFDANFSTTINQTTHYESIISISITNQEKTIGFVICLHENSYYFSFDNFKLMRSLIGHSSLALANSMLRDQLQELANKDHLTKLYLRRYLDTIIAKSIAKNEGGVFILLDVDDFKTVNDTYGHETGDDVLKQIATHIAENVSEIGVAARWGGEEFAIYLPATTKQVGKTIAEKLIKEIPSATTPSVTISAGLEGWTSEKPMEFKELFQNTDSALYAAKENGKNHLVMHGTNSPGI